VIRDHLPSGASTARPPGDHSAGRGSDDDDEDGERREHPDSPRPAAGAGRRDDRVLVRIDDRRLIGSGERHRVGLVENPPLDRRRRGGYRGCRRGGCARRRAAEEGGVDCGDGDGARRLRAGR